MSGHSGLPLSSTSEILVTKIAYILLPTKSTQIDYSGLYAYSQGLETQTSNFVFDFVEEGELSNGKYKSNQKWVEFALCRENL